jgi:hypothetical protein
LCIRAKLGLRLLRTLPTGEVNAPSVISFVFFSASD